MKDKKCAIGVMTVLVILCSIGYPQNTEAKPFDLNTMLKKMMQDAETDKPENKDSIEKAWEETFYDKLFVSTKAPKNNKEKVVLKDRSEKKSTDKAHKIPTTKKPAIEKQDSDEEETKIFNDKKWRHRSLVKDNVDATQPEKIILQNAKADILKQLGQAPVNSRKNNDVVKTGKSKQDDEKDKATVVRTEKPPTINTVTDSEKEIIDKSKPTKKKKEIQTKTQENVPKVDEEHEKLLKLEKERTLFEIEQKQRAHEQENGKHVTTKKERIENLRQEDERSKSHREKKKRRKDEKQNKTRGRADADAQSENESNDGGKYSNHHQDTYGKESLQKEQLRPDKEQLERERNEQEQEERKRHEQEQQDKERYERKQRERKRQESEQQERERQEREKQEQERYEQELRERESALKERKRLEREQQRQEREHIELERQERERQEQQQLERDLQHREQRDRDREERKRQLRERERQQRLENERIERDQLERRNERKREKERELFEKKRQEILEKEREEQEHRRLESLAKEVQNLERIENDIESNVTENPQNPEEESEESEEVKSFNEGTWQTRSLNRDNARVIQNRNRNISPAASNNKLQKSTVSTAGAKSNSKNDAGSQKMAAAGFVAARLGAARMAAARTPSERMEAAKMAAAGMAAARLGAARMANERNNTSSQLNKPNRFNGYSNAPENVNNEDKRDSYDQATKDPVTTRSETLYPNEPHISDGVTPPPDEMNIKIQSKSTETTTEPALIVSRLQQLHEDKTNPSTGQNNIQIVEEKIDFKSTKSLDASESEKLSSASMAATKLAAAKIAAAKTPEERMEAARRAAVGMAAARKNTERLAADKNNESTNKPYIPEISQKHADPAKANTEVSGKDIGDNNVQASKLDATQDNYTISVPIKTETTPTPITLQNTVSNNNPSIPTNSPTIVQNNGNSLNKSLISSSDQNVRLSGPEQEDQNNSENLNDSAASTKTTYQDETVDQSHKSIAESEKMVAAGMATARLAAMRMAVAKTPEERMEASRMAAAGMATARLASARIEADKKKAKTNSNNVQSVSKQKTQHPKSLAKTHITTVPSKHYQPPNDDGDEEKEETKEFNNDRFKVRSLTQIRPVAKKHPQSSVNSQPLDEGKPYRNTTPISNNLNNNKPEFLNTATSTVASEISQNVALSNSKTDTGAKTLTNPETSLTAAPTTSTTTTTPSSTTTTTSSTTTTPPPTTTTPPFTTTTLSSTTTTPVTTAITPLVTTTTTLTTTTMPLTTTTMPSTTTTTLSTTNTTPSINMAVRVDIRNLSRSIAPAYPNSVINGEYDIESVPTTTSSSINNFGNSLTLFENKGSEDNIYSHSETEIALGLSNKTDEEKMKYLESMVALAAVLPPPLAKLIHLAYNSTKSYLENVKNGLIPGSSVNPNPVFEDFKVNSQTPESADVTAPVTMQQPILNQPPTYKSETTQGFALTQLTTNTEPTTSTGRLEPTDVTELPQNEQTTAVPIFRTSQTLPFSNQGFTTPPSTKSSLSKTTGLASQSNNRTYLLHYDSQSFNNKANSRPSSHKLHSFRGNRYRDDSNEYNRRDSRKFGSHYGSGRFNDRYEERGHHKRRHNDRESHRRREFESSSNEDLSTHNRKVEEAPRKGKPLRKVRNV